MNHSNYYISIFRLNWLTQTASNLSTSNNNFSESDEIIEDATLPANIGIHGAYVPPDSSSDWLPTPAEFWDCCHLQ